MLEPDDDVDTLTRLRRLHARPLGQVVCEPAPDGGSAALAYRLLAALGKTIDVEPPRDPLRHLIDLHLRAERVRHLVVLRAHTLTYPALRRVADHAHMTGAQLWLVVHQERAPTPVAQLLEVSRTRRRLCRRWSRSPKLRDDDSGLDVPLGRGLEFPYLASIHDRYEPLHELIDQDAADAVLALARAGDTASEIYVRIRAALDAFQRAGVKTNLGAVDAVFEHSYGQTRPAGSTPPPHTPPHTPPRTPTKPRIPRSRR